MLHVSFNTFDHRGWPYVVRPSHNVVISGREKWLKIWYSRIKNIEIQNPSDPAHLAIPYSPPPCLLFASYIPHWRHEKSLRVSFTSFPSFCPTKKIIEDIIFKLTLNFSSFFFFFSISYLSLSSALHDIRYTITIWHRRARLDSEFNWRRKIWIGKLKGDDIRCIKGDIFVFNDHHCITMHQYND